MHLECGCVIGGAVVADDDAVHAEHSHVLNVLHQVWQLVLHLRAGGLMGKAQSLA